MYATWGSSQTLPASSSNGTLSVSISPPWLRDSVKGIIKTHRAALLERPTLFRPLALTKKPTSKQAHLHSAEEDRAQEGCGSLLSLCPPLWGRDVFHLSVLVWSVR